MEMKVLVDNVVYKKQLNAEHGLSFLITVDNQKILFDTGQTDLFIKNAKLLGETLKDVDYVVLSHGHLDHTGGLTHFLSINKNAKVLLKKAALQRKYSNSSGNLQEIGLRPEQLNSSFPNEIIYLEENYKINDKIEIICNISNYTDFESDEKNLFIKQQNEFIPDPFEDELFLLIKENNKINIITGCAHRGIVNICKTAVDYSGNTDINLLIGGTHLKGKSEERLIKTINELKNMKMNKIVAGHCTGIESCIRMKDSIGKSVIYGAVGTELKL